MTKRWLVYLIAPFQTLSFAGSLNISDRPLFLTDAVSPLTMIIMGRDHKLYYEAYNDTLDLDGNGVLDIIETRFDPTHTYFGYFDANKCYGYGSGRFSPSGLASGALKTCSGQWSGNFLNYVTTSRFDALRKVLYGGYRSVDTTSETVLERAYIPQDAHSWGKEYTSVAINGYSIADYTPLSLPTNGNRHIFANTTLLKSGNDEPRLRVAANVSIRVWEWLSRERPVAGDKAINGQNNEDVNIKNNTTDYLVRVKVCDVNVGLEDNCHSYPNNGGTTIYKPIGILQQFGENDAMYFGLITGSYDNNTQGGILRKNIGTITDEINAQTGQLLSTIGIIRTIDRLGFIDFPKNKNYEHKCGWAAATRPINPGECSMWGNPIAEMMYEALRYFAGRSAPTPSYTNLGNSRDNSLGLPAPTWQNPYAGNTPYCAKPNILVISDIYPSYDTNGIPGSHWGGISDDLGGFNASSLASTIWNGEFGGSKLHFIGESAGSYDGAPTAKTVSSFGNIRGLSPEEPTKEGGYYTASAAYFGRINDISSVTDDQFVYTYAVALASPLPEIVINAGGSKITLVPFGKSVGGFGINPTQGLFQPTNTIVDFYVESLTPTSGTFRINFEDVEQGADHDMDAIVRYEYVVNADNTVTITLNSTYAAGGIKQHMGYVISGTTNDGLYLEVRDKDTGSSKDPDYFLDTPPNQFHNPSGSQAAINPNDSSALPLVTSRTFTPSNSGTNVATQIKNPLWFAAKWGGFNDFNEDRKPSVTEEFDEDADGVPDNYFLVTNASRLADQLEKAFNKIVDRSGSFSSASLSSGFLNSSTRIYQAIYKTQKWYGQLLAFDIDDNTGEVDTSGPGPDGSLWDAGEIVTNQNYNSGRKIITYKPSSAKGIPFRWPTNVASPGINELDVDQINALNLDSFGAIRLDYLRGDPSNEKRNGGHFRDREIVLGDIIHSAPLLISQPNFPYPAGLSGAGQNYADFKITHSGRRQILYVGSNDGMLHAFDASTGTELLAYVPSTIYNNLASLSSPSYSHKYYVDGTPVAVDAQIGGNWHTVLMGGLQAGGQGIYALDITNPSMFSESNADQIVLWEFNDSDDSDLGYTYSKPSIVKAANGQWVAIFGNGYNNTFSDNHPSVTGNAVIYVVDIQTGSIIRKFDTFSGMAQDPTGLSKPNGMSTPAVVDINGDSIADYIYAGDLFGNMWKIDITSPNSGQWDFSFFNSGNPAPLFTAINAAGEHQPIVSAPAVAKVPSYLNQLYVYFGTGKYFEVNDSTNTQLQTVYAIRDLNDGTQVSSRNQLLKQFITFQDDSYRVTSNFTMASSQLGWYMDLSYNGYLNGERVISDIIYRDQKIIFTTIIPSADPCKYGGTSWLMELNAYNGGLLSYSPFDINEDNRFDSGDNYTYNSDGISTSTPVSGLQSDVGLVASPAVLDAGDTEYKYMPGTSGDIQTVTENPGLNVNGRQSWRQVR